MGMLYRLMKLAAGKTGGLPTLAAREVRDMNPARMQFARDMAFTRGRPEPAWARRPGVLGDRSAYDAGLQGDELMPLMLGSGLIAGASAVPMGLNALNEGREFASDPDYNAWLLEQQQALAADEDLAARYYEMRQRRLEQERK